MRDRAYPEFKELQNRGDGGKIYADKSLGPLQSTLICSESGKENARVNSVPWNQSRHDMGRVQVSPNGPFERPEVLDDRDKIEGTFCVPELLSRGTPPESVQSTHKRFDETNLDSGFLQFQRDENTEDIFAAETPHSAATLGADGRLNHPHFADVNDTMRRPANLVGHLF
jgi:hypothetical protein